MSDIEALRTMLDKAGVVYTQMETVQFKELRGITPLPVPGLTVRIETYGSDKNYGYCSFVSDFYFTADGALFGTGAWE